VVRSEYSPGHRALLRRRVRYPLSLPSRSCSLSGSAMAWWVMCAATQR
jgi:hypothetical protein